jgi:hypothetical protein
MKEAYVSFETAKLLKEKGFDEECYKFYTYDTKEVYREDIPCYNSRSDDYAVPAHQMVCAWVRDKGYHIYTFMRKDNVWVYEIQKLDEDWTFSFGGFEEHDEAIEEAIKYVLENLI